MTKLNITTATAALIVAASAAGHQLVEVNARELIKTHNALSTKRIAEIVETLNKPKATRRIRSERVIEAGTRGFNISSKVWLESVRTATGISVHPSNINKLKAHAKAIGVSSAGTDQVAICQLIVEAGLTPKVEEVAA
jgi:hypothetical protein